MKVTNLLMNYTLYFSSFKENSKHIITYFLSPNNHRSIISSSFFAVKFLIVFSIKSKYVIEETIKNFNTKKDELVIPWWLFDEREQVAICLKFTSKNEKYIAYFINKLVSSTRGKAKFNVVRNKRKMQSLLPLKEKFST